ncbi:MAG: ABC transporter permease subunit [Treponema sp.]|jgi:putative aldouronate transport system permease protein|nr:ABC transporter permease subunit [Treponema sp.]
MSVKDLLQDYKKRKYIYWMMVPVMIYYVVFHYIPMLGQVIAFQSYRPARGILGSPWVGLRNFITFFRGPFSGRVIKNTIILSLYDILFVFPMPIILALLLNELRGGKFKRIAQTITYMPHFISLVIMCGMIVNFTSSRGVITSLLGWFGLSPTNLLSKPQYFRTIYTASTVWKTIGWGSIIYLATLSTVDVNLYEAASIDGAGRFRKIYHIMIPSLIPIVAIQLIMRIGNIMSMGAEKVILLYSPIVYDTADTISSYVYRVGLSEQNYSLASAVGMFNSVVNLGLLVFANWFSRRYVQESLW